MIDFLSSYKCQYDETTCSKGKEEQVVCFN